MIKIGNISFNLDVCDGMSEKTFIEAYEGHYKHIGKGRYEKMKEDYKELKKSFTPKKKREEAE